MPQTLRVEKGGRSEVITNLGMDAAVSGAIDVRGMNTLKLEVKTTRSAHTTVVVTVTECYNLAFAAGDTYAVTETQAGGATANATFTYTASTDAKFAVGLKVGLFDYIKITVTGASGGASDKVWVNITPVNE